MVVSGYARFLANYPYIVVGVVSVLTLTCLIVIIALVKKPDFTDPKLGFEARGTELSSRIRSYEKLLEETNGILTRSGNHFISTSQIGTEQEFRLKYNNVMSINKKRGRESLNPIVTEDSDNVMYFLNASTENYFCDIPRTDYARYTYTTKDSSNLFTLANIHDMCEMDQSISSQSSYRENCVRQERKPAYYTSAQEQPLNNTSFQCCPSWSLSAYLMLMNNRSSCFHLTNTDIEVTLDTLQQCVKYSQKLLFCGEEYNDERVSKDRNRKSLSAGCKEIPSECLQDNAVYHILHFITDNQFVTKAKVGQSLKLTYAMTFIPLAVGKSTRDLYHDMVHKVELSRGNIVIAGIEFGLKEIMFDEYLKADSVFFVMAFCAVTLVMWIYTSSLFITIMAFINMLNTLIISYFLYSIVFEIDFFPYMNLLVLVILIGVGVDDVFLYCRTWNLAKFEKNIGTLEKLISDTLKHATLSMLVTSLTTSAAIYANIINKITALRCFAIFGGTTIFVNFLVMISWVPATIVLHNKWCSNLCGCCREPEDYSNKKTCRYVLCKFQYKIFFYISEWSRRFFGKILPYVIVKLRYLWIILFGILCISGIIVVLYYPKLKLPSSNEFQMFAQTHPFEVYNFKVKDYFWFEKAAGTSTSTVPLTVVWGITAQDTGNKLDPFSKTTLKYDSNFDFNTQDGQRYLLKFCRDLRSSPWYQDELGPDFTNCFIESFIRYMDRPCKSPVGSYSPCCDESVFPYVQSVYSQCLEEWMNSVEKSRHLYYIHPTAGPRFDKNTGEIVAIIAEVNSQQPYSFSYESMSEFYFSMKQWVEEKMVLAPEGLKGAWFVSDLTFFDLQHSLATGTPVAMGVSIALATVFAFVTTLNVLITFISIISITGTIFTVVAVLVLLEWELNIMESVTITVAVGLAIDFTLHYGMAYRLAPSSERESRVMCATQRVGSVVAAAAVSTFLAGLCMCPSSIQAYRQLGVFLMLIMLISWLYATLFFQSLLYVFGPTGGFSQFHCFSLHCDTCCAGQEHVDKTVYTMTESTTTSSSSTANNHAHNASNSESHEMEPLASEEETDTTFSIDVQNDLKYCQILSPTSPKTSSSQLLSTDAITDSTDIIFDTCNEDMYTSVANNYNTHGYTPHNNNNHNQSQNDNKTMDNIGNYRDKNKVLLLPTSLSHNIIDTHSSSSSLPISHSFPLQCNSAHNAATAWRNNIKCNSHNIDDNKILNSNNTLSAPRHQTVNKACDNRRKANHVISHSADSKNSRLTAASQPSSLDETQHHHQPKTALEDEVTSPLLINKNVQGHSKKADAASSDHEDIWVKNEIFI